jgi:hypothetical protein
MTQGAKIIEAENDQILSELMSYFVNETVNSVEESLHNHRERRDFLFFNNSSIIAFK